MVYLFLGKEYFLKKQAIGRLNVKINGSLLPNLNYDEFKAGEDALNTILDCAKTAPFMASFRLLVVEEANRFNQEEKESLAAFIAKNPAGIILVLAADLLPPSDIIYKAAAKYGKLINFDLLKGEKLYKWISDKFLSFNKRIQPEAVKALVDNAGNSLMRLNLAIESLVTFIGESDIVRISDVENLIGKSLEITAYELVDAVSAKNTSMALQILQGLDKDAKTISQALGLIGWHLRRIWRVKKLANQRAPLSAITASVSMPHYARDSFFRQVNNFSAQEIEKDFKILLKADRDIKSTSTEPYRALELLVVRLCVS